MKKLPVTSPSLLYLEKSFKEWLDIMGYAESTVKSMPYQIRGLFHFMEARGFTGIHGLDAGLIKSYYEHLKQRENQLYGGGLGNGHLNKHIQALRKFCEYLRRSGRLEIGEPPMPNEKQPEQSPRPLTKGEITALFASTYRYPDLPPNRREAFITAMQYRDRAMLSVYYGCGARMTEGVSLDVGDIDFDRSMLHIRKGKNYKERFVPISKICLKHLQEYVYDHRGELLRGKKTDALFVSDRGKRVCGQSLFLRLRYLVFATDNPQIIEKQPGLHLLRHSIATHLMEGGMKIESIQRFLGHSSMDSTQIYTHLTGGVKQQTPKKHFEVYAKLHEDE